MDQRPWWKRIDGLPPRAVGARENWRPLTTVEWVVVAASAVILLAINKLLIEDAGSSWITVVYMGGLLGFGAVLVARWLRARLATAPSS